MTPTSPVELILTAEECLGLTSASPMQRARCRLLDGAPLGDLADDPDVAAMVGCDPHTLPAVLRPEILDLEPVRCGKTLGNVAWAIARTQTVDVTPMRAGEEPPRISVLSTDRDGAQTFRGHLELARTSPALRELIIGDTADSMTFRHPSGIPITIQVVAAHRGGYSLHTKWQAGVDFEEAPGWGSTDKVVSLEENRDTALGRVLPGGQILYSGSPWQPSGLCWDLWSEHFGHPTDDLLVIQARPAWKLNPVYWTEERVARIKRTSARTFKMHLLAEFGSAQNAALDYDAVIRAFRWPTDGDGFELTANLAEPVVVIDASSLRPWRDWFTAMVVGWTYPTPAEDRPPRLSRQDDGTDVVQRDAVGQIIMRETLRRPLLRVHQIAGWGGDVGDADTEGVVAAIAGMAHAWGARNVIGDQREDAALAPLFRRHRLGFRSYPWSLDSKDAAVTTIKRLMAEDRLSIVEHDETRKQLLAYGYRLLPGGRFSYQGRGPHDDFAALFLTLAHALNDDETHGVETGGVRLEGELTARGSRRTIVHKPYSY